MTDLAAGPAPAAAPDEDPAARAARLAAEAVEVERVAAEALHASLVRRTIRLQECNADPTRRAIELELCRRDPVYWFNTWCWTYNPKNAGTSVPANLPFDLFPRQEEMIRWLEERLRQKEEGLIEKSRDIGFTWLMGGFALHHWLFVSGFKTAFGSRKEDLVDKIGDPDSIFEKIRMLLRGLPHWMLPGGFNWRKHSHFSRLVNPISGNVITGEAGDNIGRGGRNSLYVIDEGAFLEHPDTVDVAVNANADCRIWGSSVNGMGNLFARKRHSGRIPVFTFHWKHDPRKTEAWAEKKKHELIDEWKFASEYDLDYSASVEGICVPAKWVKAAIELGKRLQIVRSKDGVGGLDIGAGKAKSVYVERWGPIITIPQARKDPDTTDTALWALECAEKGHIEVLNFDAPGVGAGVSSTLSKKKIPGCKTQPINTGVPPSDITVWPDGRKSSETFANLKAELWWIMRERFRACFEHLLWLDAKEGGKEYALNELTIFPESPDPETQALQVQLSTPKWFRRHDGKIILESKEQLTKRGISSPDHADALALTFVPEKIPHLIGFLRAAAEDLKRRQEAGEA